MVEEGCVNPVVLRQSLVLLIREDGASRIGISEQHQVSGLVGADAGVRIGRVGGVQQGVRDALVRLGEVVDELEGRRGVVVREHGRSLAGSRAVPHADRQVEALYRGGVQKLFVGNVKQGQNRLTAFFTGRGPSGRDYRRATTVEFEKSFEPAFVELAISDSGAKYQPEFSAAVSN